jgi:hypothetical protein
MYRFVSRDDGFRVRCSLAPDEILFLRVSRTRTPATEYLPGDISFLTAARGGSGGVLYTVYNNNYACKRPFSYNNIIMRMYVYYVYMHNACI